MSLIPSESYSFPDHFTNTVAASRKPKKAEPEPEPQSVHPPRLKPEIVALPNPKPQSSGPVVVNGSPQPARKIAPPVPNPALRRAAAPPPRIPEPSSRKIALPATLKPKMRWNNRTPANPPTPPPAINGNGNGSEQIEGGIPMQNVIQMRPQAPGGLRRQESLAAPNPIFEPGPEPWPQNLPPPDPLPTRPAPSVAKRLPPPPRVGKPVQTPAIPQRSRPAQAPIPQTDFFEMFEETGEAATLTQRRKEKMRRFIFCESIAAGVLLPLALLGLLVQPESPALRWILNISTISAAVAAALIPIVFFAVTPTLPEIER